MCVALSSATTSRLREPLHQQYVERCHSMRMRQIAKQHAHFAAAAHDLAHHSAMHAVLTCMATTPCTIFMDTTASYIMLTMQAWVTTIMLAYSHRSRLYKSESAARRFITMTCQRLQGLRRLGRPLKQSSSPRPGAAAVSLSSLPAYTCKVSMFERKSGCAALEASASTPSIDTRCFGMEVILRQFQPSTVARPASHVWDH